MNRSAHRPYVGRFAPSPTGLLHAGSLVAALASWLDARANAGRWLVRIEDLDTPRNVAGAAEAILGQLERCGLRPDEAPVRQSTRVALYERALDRLLAADLAYPGGCSRRDLALAGAPAESGPLHPVERVYPG
ncbi:MAG: glutamate--tRNA ligase family protein, partial [Caldimonas sp.]